MIIQAVFIFFLNSICFSSTATNLFQTLSNEFRLIQNLDEHLGDGYQISDILKAPENLDHILLFADIQKAEFWNALIKSNMTPELKKSKNAVHFKDIFNEEQLKKCYRNPACLNFLKRDLGIQSDQIFEADAALNSRSNLPDNLHSDYPMEFKDGEQLRLFTELYEEHCRISTLFWDEITSSDNAVSAKAAENILLCANASADIARKILTFDDHLDIPDSCKRQLIWTLQNETVQTEVHDNQFKLTIAEISALKYTFSIEPLLYNNIDGIQMEDNFGSLESDNGEMPSSELLSYSLINLDERFVQGVTIDDIVSLSQLIIDCLGSFSVIEMDGTTADSLLTNLTDVDGQKLFFEIFQPLSQSLANEIILKKPVLFSMSVLESLSPKITLTPEVLRKIQYHSTIRQVCIPDFKYTDNNALIYLNSAIHDHTNLAPLKFPTNFKQNENIGQLISGLGLDPDSYMTEIMNVDPCSNLKSIDFITTEQLYTNINRKCFLHSTDFSMVTEDNKKLYFYLPYAELEKRDDFTKVVRNLSVHDLSLVNDDFWRDILPCHLQLIPCNIISIMSTFTFGLMANCTFNDLTDDQVKALSDSVLFSINHENTILAKRIPYHRIKACNDTLLKFFTEKDVSEMTLEFRSAITPDQWKNLPAASYAGLNDLLDIPAKSTNYWTLPMVKYIEENVIIKAATEQREAIGIKVTDELQSPRKYINNLLNPPTKPSMVILIIIMILMGIVVITILASFTYGFVMHRERTMEVCNTAWTKCRETAIYTGSKIKEASIYVAAQMKKGYQWMMEKTQPARAYVADKCKIAYAKVAAAAASIKRKISTASTTESRTSKVADPDNATAPDVLEAERIAEEAPPIEAELTLSPIESETIDEE